MWAFGAGLTEAMPPSRCRFSRILTQRVVTSKRSAASLMDMPASVTASTKAWFLEWDME